MSRRKNHHDQVSIGHHVSSFVKTNSKSHATYISVFDVNKTKTYTHKSAVCRGSSEAMKQAYTLITALIKDPEVDILQMLPKSKPSVVTTSSWDKAVSTVAVSIHQDECHNGTI